MSQKIMFRRGTNAVRQTVVFDQGEPVWTTDTKKVFFGDGVTAGGIPMSVELGDSFITIAPPSGNSKVENGTLLRNAIIGSKNKLPYTLPRSDTNRFSILLYPGIYASTGLSDTMPVPRYTNIVGIGAGVVIDASANSDGIGLYIGSGYVNCENFSFIMAAGGGIVLGLQDLDKPVTGIQLKNIVYSGESSAPFLVSQATKTERMLIDSVNPTQLTTVSFLSTTTVYDLKDVTIQNLDYVGAPFFTAGLDNANGQTPIFDNVTVKNSRIRLTATSDTFMGASGLANSRVTNCQIESGAVFNTSVFGNIKISNCQLFNTLDTNSNVFQDCSFIKTSAIASYTIDISNPTFFPSFYNCSFISTNNSTTVTGTVGSSGMFVNCVFNTVPFTGATGFFGPQGSRYDARYR